MKLKLDFKAILKFIIICFRAVFILLNSFIWIFVGILIIQKQYDICLDSLYGFVIFGLCGVYFFEIYYGVKKLREERKE